MLVKCVAGDMLDELVSMLTGGVADESFDIDDSESAVTSSAADCNDYNVLSLLELSSRAVAKHCSCATLEKHSPPLDEGLLRRVAVSMLYLCLKCSLQLSFCQMYTVYVHLYLYVCLIGGSVN